MSLVNEIYRCWIIAPQNQPKSVTMTDMNTFEIFPNGYSADASFQFQHVVNHEIEYCTIKNLGELLMIHQIC